MRAKTTLNHFTFVKGRVSDSGPLASPDNSLSDECNLVFDINGSINRRKGLSTEPAFVNAPSVPYISSTVTDDKSISSYLWYTNNGGFPLYVVSSDDTLKFYVTSNTSLYGSGTSVHTETLTTAYTKPSDYHGLSFATVAGRLVVTGAHIIPICFTWDGTTVVSSNVTLYERDTTGFNENVAPDYRPTSLSTKHKYNLLNAGWAFNHISSFTGSTGGYYPSLADLYSAGFYVNPSTGLDSFNPENVRNAGVGSSFAPKGRFILDALTKVVQNADSAITNAYAANQVTITGVSAGPVVFTLTCDTSNLHVGDVITFTNGKTFTVTQDTATIITDLTLGAGTTATLTDVDSVGGTIKFHLPPESVPQPHTLDTYTENLYSNPWFFTTNTSGSISYLDAETSSMRWVTAYAGRAWYGGCKSSAIGNKIYFSQIINSDTSALGNCYQAADPTSRDISDIVATDGGTVVIGEMANSIGAIQVGNNLVVFGTNGTWAIAGKQGSFTADSYSVRKISDAVIVSPSAVVSGDGMAIFWASNGIYAIQEDNVSGFAIAKSITDGVIRTYLQEQLPPDMMRGVRAAFDKVNKRAIWTYSDGVGSTSCFRHNRAIAFDFRLGCFYSKSFEPANTNFSSTTKGYICGLTYQPDSSDGFKLKYTVKLGSKIYVMVERDNKYRDFFVDNPDATMFYSVSKAFGITNYISTGDNSRKKQAPYVTTFLSNDVADNAGFQPDCLFQACWDYTNSSESSKWTAKQSCYRIVQSSFDVIRAKHRIRGTGRGLALRFESVGQQPFTLFGWSIEMESNQNV